MNNSITRNGTFFTTNSTGPSNDVKITDSSGGATASGGEISVLDEDIQQKIDAIKTRLIKQYGYNEQSATDVLDYVGSIFARGDVAEEEE